MGNKIVILNHFREDAVMATVQKDNGEMYSNTIDFPEIRDEKLQMALALIDILSVPSTEWSDVLLELFEENKQAIAREIDEFNKSLLGPDDGQEFELTITPTKYSEVEEESE